MRVEGVKEMESEKEGTAGKNTVSKHHLLMQAGVLINTAHTHTAW